MGYIRHDAIVVTSWKREDLSRARDKAVMLGLFCTPLQEEMGVNGYSSFLICPDGSKEGWDDSDHHDKLREEWVSWVGMESAIAGKSVETWDKCLNIDWVYVSFGGDEPHLAHVVSRSGYFDTNEEEDYMGYYSETGTNT